MCSRCLLGCRLKHLLHHQRGCTHERSKKRFPSVRSQTGLDIVRAGNTPGPTSMSEGLGRAYHPGDPGVEVLRLGLDRAPFAGGRHGPSTGSSHALARLLDVGPEDAYEFLLKGSIADL